MGTTVTELVWLMGLMKELEVEINQPVQIFTDTKAAMQIVANPVYHERTKHIEIDCHFIREKINQGMVTYVARTQMRMSDTGEDLEVESFMI